jgi:hypothetical protein
LKLKLDKLNDTSRKNDVVTFEELGVDRLFVDEADFYKNLFLYTKMRNVAGLSQTEAQKSSDMFAKCRYLDELTEGRGIHREIIDYCIQTKRLYESRDYHNAVFIGFDRHGVSKYATLRGTFGKRFMGK